MQYSNNHFPPSAAVPIWDQEKIFENRIHGGKNTTIETHPYIVSLRWIVEHWCGASLLSPTRALSAGHCVRYGYPANGYQILAGSTLVDGDGSEQFRNLTRFLQHPKFVWKTRTNDIALLFWKQPLIFDAKVRPISLPPQNNHVPYGRNGIVVGWGRIRQNSRFPINLKVKMVSFVGQEECNRTYDGINPVTNDMLCATPAACESDDGGPLIVDNILIGVVSWGEECDFKKPSFPDVHARVAFFTNWIRKYL